MPAGVARRIHKTNCLAFAFCATSACEMNSAAARIRLKSGFTPTNKRVRSVAAICVCRRRRWGRMSPNDLIKFKHYRRGRGRFGYFLWTGLLPQGCARLNGFIRCLPSVGEQGKTNTACDPINF